jgi:hypothetical protein
MKDKELDNKSSAVSRISSLRFYAQGLRLVTCNIGILILSFVISGMTGIFNGSDWQSNNSAAIGLLIIGMTITFIALQVILTSFGRVLYTYYGILAERKEESGLKSAAVFSLNRVPQMIGLSIIMGILAILCILCAPLGIYIFNRLSLAQYFLVEDGLNVGAALRKSWETVKGRGWEVLSVRLIPALFILPVLISFVAIWQVVLLLNGNSALLFSYNSNFSAFVNQSGMILLMILTIVPACLYILSLSFINYPLATINMARVKALIMKTNNRLSIWPAIVGIILFLIFLMQIIAGFIYAFSMYDKYHKESDVITQKCDTGYYGEGYTDRMIAPVCEN